MVIDFSHLLIVFEIVCSEMFGGGNQGHFEGETRSSALENKLTLYRCSVQFKLLN